MRKSVSHLSRAFICAVALSTVAYGIPFGPITIAEAASNYSTVLLQDSPAAYWRFRGGPGGTNAAHAPRHKLPLPDHGLGVLGPPGARGGGREYRGPLPGSEQEANRR